MDFTWLFIKMILLLGVVSVLAVLVLKYAVPRMTFVKRLAGNSFFKILGRQTLEPGKSLYVVQTNKRYLMIGVADHAINLITELSKDEIDNEGR